MVSRRVTRGVVHGSHHGSVLQPTLALGFFARVRFVRETKDREKKKKKIGKKESMYELKSRLVPFRDVRAKSSITSLAVISRRDFVST